MTYCASQPEKMWYKYWGKINDDWEGFVSIKLYTVHLNPDCTAWARNHRQSRSKTTPLRTISAIEWPAISIDGKLPVNPHRAWSGRVLRRASPTPPAPLAPPPTVNSSKWTDENAQHPRLSLFTNPIKNSEQSSVWNRVGKRGRVWGEEEKKKAQSTLITFAGVASP